MIKKEMIAMLLAGGQGSRLGVLTAKVAKPAVAFGGKYRIIDFPLSNCINSGVDKTAWRPSCAKGEGLTQRQIKPQCFVKRPLSGVKTNNTAVF